LPPVLLSVEREGVAQERLLGDTRLLVSRMTGFPV
jgi:hypothetical protein